MSEKTIVIKESVLREIIDQLCFCNFQCEAGHIEFNASFQKLVMIADNCHQMTPIWELAPEWAEWWAMDRDGSSYWYAEKPNKAMPMNFWVSVGGNSVIDKTMGETVPEWDKSLRARGEV